MFKYDETKQKQENLHRSIRIITRGWPMLKKDLGIFREEIAHEFFQANPQRHQLFESSEDMKASDDDAVKKKLLKHSTAVINSMEAIVDFVNGNEESKPMYYLLGRHHKNLNVNEKMFLEMKDAICKIIKLRFSSQDSHSWATVLEYIYINYVFPGMQIWKEIHCSGSLNSAYAKYFKEPVLNPDKIEQVLKERERDELLAMKVKAAQNNQTCSVIRDPDIDIFTNYIMRKGKKEHARDVLENAFILIKHIQLRKYNSETDAEKQKTIILNPREIFFLAVKNTSPLFSVQNIRKSGSWYKVPTGITEKSAKVLAMKWIIEVSREKNTRKLYPKPLAHELIAASQYEGKALAKKIELHKLCESNRSYLHLWWT